MEVDLYDYTPNSDIKDLFEYTPNSDSKLGC